MKQELTQKEKIEQDAKQRQKAAQNPCGFCPQSYEVEVLGGEIQEAEYIYKAVCLGIPIKIPLCEFHYLERVREDDKND